MCRVSDVCINAEAHISEWPNCSGVRCTYPRQALLPVSSCGSDAAVCADRPAGMQCNAVLRDAPRYPNNHTSAHTCGVLRDLMSCSTPASPATRPTLLQSSTRTQLSSAAVSVAIVCPSAATQPLALFTWHSVRMHTHAMMCPPTATDPLMLCAQHHHDTMCAEGSNLGLLQGQVYI